MAHVKDLFSTMMWSLGFPIPAVWMIKMFCPYNKIKNLSLSRAFSCNFQNVVDTNDTNATLP